LTPRFDALILAPNTVSDESLVKFRQQKPKIYCKQSLLKTRARTDGRTHGRTNTLKTMLQATPLAEA